MANFFAQFHDEPTEGAPSGFAAPQAGAEPAKDNYFSQFHPEGEVKGGTVTVPAKDGKPARVIMDMSSHGPDRGVADAAGRGAAQGLSAGFADEIRGLVEAGGANPEDPASVYNLIHGALRYWSGDDEAKKRYDETVKRERDADKAAEEHHALAHGLGQVGGVMGTLAVAPASASQGATWLARALSAAKQGAAYGAASGAGEGEGAADTAVKAGSGLVLGGALGGVAAPLIEGAGQAARYATKKIGNVWRGATNPEAEAGRQYLTALEADRQADPNFVSRMTPAEYHANPDARLMDLGGGAVKRLADVASMTSPKGQTILKHEIDQRFEGQSGRFSDWFRSNFHYPDAYQQQQALDQVAKSVNRPAYKKAYEEGDKQIWSPELERLTAAPYVQSALGSAISKWKNYAVRDGYGAANPPFRIENGGLIKTGGGGLKAYPNIQLWDYAARELQDAARAAPPGSQTAGLYNDLARQLKTELDNIVPSYKAAREGAAGFFKAENALEAGQKFVTSNTISLSEARAALSKMSPAERRLFTDGFVSDFVDKVVNTTGDRRDILQKIANNPQARAKLELVLGRDKYAELEAKIRVEGIFDDVRKAVQGNSWTARRLYDMGLAGGAGLGAHGSYSTDPKEVATGALIAALASGGKKINANVATKLAEMLVSRDPAVVQKGFKAFSGNSRFMDALRDADTKIGRVVSDFAPVNPALSAAGVARADDQKRAPRPPGK